MNQQTLLNINDGKSLKQKLIDFLTDNPESLKDIYSKFKGESKTTIRGRLNESVNKKFVRLDRGVYIAVRGKSKALLLEGDSWKKIKKISRNSMDLIIADSPYSILNKDLAAGTTRKKEGKWSFATKDIDEELFKEFLRVLKPGGHFFSFLPADNRNTLEYNNEHIKTAQKAGLTFNKRFIWDKVQLGMGYSGRSRYEQIIFFSKGKRRFPQNLSTPDVLTRQRISPQRRVHETEKPLELIQDLIYFSTAKNEWVLDPFSGSFKTSQAALITGRNSIGIEIDKTMVRQAQKRLGASKIPVRQLVRRKDGVKQHYHKKVKA